MRRASGLVRIAALAALAVGVIAVGWVLLGGGSSGYELSIRFQNASQLVKGNLVQVSGKPVGSVEKIELTDDGQAEVHVAIDESYEPLRRGTRAIVRASSLSGVANRYIDLQLGPADAEPIADGGVIGQDATTTAVDLDQLFNTIGPKQREAISRLIQGFAGSYAGRGTQANRGWLYLNPALATSSKLFSELNYDTPLLERFIVASSKLVTDLADRREDLAGLVSNLSQTTGAIGAQKQALEDAVRDLPAFLRRANTTFVNLRSTLDHLDPLVKDSEPAAKRLGPFLTELRGLASNARPTLRDLSRLISRDGKSNDLVELTRATTRLDKIATRPVFRNGETREGAFQASAKALEGSLTPLAFARPYAVDLTGWFDDYSHSGFQDALGGASRVSPNVSAFALQGSFPGITMVPIPPELRGAAFGAVASLNQRMRCPGSVIHAADPGPIKPSDDYPCDETQILPGD